MENKKYYILKSVDPAYGYRRNAQAPVVTIATEMGVLRDQFLYDLASGYAYDRRTNTNPKSLAALVKVVNKCRALRGAGTYVSQVTAAEKKEYLESLSGERLAELEKNHVTSITVAR